jgi:hypothetical protein
MPKKVTKKRHHGHQPQALLNPADPRLMAANLRFAPPVDIPALSQSHFDDLEHKYNLLAYDILNAVFKNTIL